MDCEIKLSKFQDIADNIIKIEHNLFENNVEVHYKFNPDGKIMYIIRYLKSNGWGDFKFNQYKTKSDNGNYVIIIDYVKPKLIFGKK